MARGASTTSPRGVDLDERLWPSGPAGRVLITTVGPGNPVAGAADACRPRRAVQPPRGADLPDRPSHRGPGPAAGCHRPGRASSATSRWRWPGQRRDRQLGTDLPRVPRALHAQARPGRCRVEAAASPRPARSAGCCPWTTPTCCRLAPRSRCSCSPRCLTATAYPARSSRPRPRATTWPTARAGGGLAGGQTVPEDGLAALESAGLLTVGPGRGAAHAADELAGPGDGAGGDARRDAGRRGAAATADAVLEAWPRRTTRRTGCPAACARAPTACGRRRDDRAVGGGLPPAAAARRAQPRRGAADRSRGQLLEGPRRHRPPVPRARTTRRPSRSTSGSPAPTSRRAGRPRRSRCCSGSGTSGRAGSGRTIRTRWTSPVSLGLALMSAGRFDEAVIVLSEAASGCERSPGPNSLTAVSAREDVAAAHRAAGRFAAAIDAVPRALADRERMQDPRHADTIAVRQKLAEAYLADGQAKAAIGQYERVVAGQGAGARPGPPAHHRRARRTRLRLPRGGPDGVGRPAGGAHPRRSTRRILGPEHPDTLAACVNLAHAYYGVGRLTDAARLLQQTIERCEQSLPRVRPADRGRAEQPREHQRHQREEAAASAAPGHGRRPTTAARAASGVFARAEQAPARDRPAAAGAAAATRRTAERRSSSRARGGSRPPWRGASTGSAEPGPSTCPGAPRAASSSPPTIAGPDVAAGLGPAARPWRDHLAGAAGNRRGGHRGDRHLAEPGRGRRSPRCCGTGLTRSRCSPRGPRRAAAPRSG